MTFGGHLRELTTLQLLSLHKHETTAWRPCTCARLSLPDSDVVQSNGAGSVINCVFAWVQLALPAVNGLMGAVSGAVLFQCLGAAIRSPPPPPPLPRGARCCCYVMNASWFSGIKPLCFTAWQTPWKVRTCPCVLWSELMAFTLLDGGNRPWSNWGVFATTQRDGLIDGKES